MTDQTEILEQDKSRFYWFLKNSRDRIFGGIKNWIKNHKILSIVLALILIYVLFTGRAAYQPLFLIIRKYLALILVVAVVFWLFSRRFKKNPWKKNFVPTIILILFLAASWIFGPGIHDYVGLYLHYSKLKKVEMTEMPITDHERIQPINSIRTLINQEALNETEEATSPRFVRGHNGKYYFTSCVGPSTNYKAQQFSKNMYEILSVPVYMPSPVFSKKYRADVDFEIGELLLFSKETDNAVTKRFGLGKYFTCEPARPLYMQDDAGKWVQVVPIIKWKGFFFPRPVFGGVYVIEQSDVDGGYMNRVLLGKGKFYSPEEVLKTKFLKGQNLQPHEVVTFTANSFKFANGFLAPMPGYHEGDIRIPKLVEDQNSMPYVTYFHIKDNPKLFNYFGLEPFEENKRGLSLSLFIAGDDDQEVYFIDHRSEKFIGSSAVPSKIQESKKNYDWSVNYAAESRPYVATVDGVNRFFWLSTVVSKAGEGKGDYIGGSIPELCLTDAVYGKVVWVNQDSLANSQLWTTQAAQEMKYYWEQE